MQINYVRGDATQPQGPGPKVIVHCVNDLGRWGAGFVLALSKRWPKAEATYRAWHNKETSGKTTIETGPFGLGQVQFVEVVQDEPKLRAEDEPKLWVANLIGQHGIGVHESQRAPIRYDAIQRGLRHVHRFALSHEASVHMPKMGTGLAMGSWTNIEQFVQSELPAQVVTVYDLP